MIALEDTYRRLARSWSADELTARYHAAQQRGAADLPAGERAPARPIALLATAVPRLISLAVATHVLHLLPSSAAGLAGLDDELLATIDRTSAGSLHRCHLALTADANSHRYQAGEWTVLIDEQAADALHRASPSADPPSLIEHAQQAGRATALAIGALDRDAPGAPEAIAEALAHLLVLSVFADTAAERHSDEL